MALNPMQRKSRISFLLGVIVTLLLSAIVIAFLLLMLKNKDEQLKAELGTEWNIYVLTQDVTAGQILTKDMFVSKKAEKELTPSNATNDGFMVESWFLQTKEGEYVGFDEFGMFLPTTKGETKIEVLKNEGQPVSDDMGQMINQGEFYYEIVGINGFSRIVKLPSKIKAEQKDGRFFAETSKTRLYVEENSTQEFYIYKSDTQTLNNTGILENKKEYIDIKNVPVLARVDMNANTVITSELIVQSDELITDDTRRVEYNMITLPVDLMTNDYVDIRLKTPQGQNLIVVSKAQVDIPVNGDGTYIVDTIRVNLREDEILAMSSAIVEAYGLLGSELYVTKYVDPAMQDAAVPTYTPNVAVTAQMQANPNIVDIAKEELAARYSDAAKNARNQYLQNAINSTEPQEYMGNIQDGVEEDLGNSLTTRKKYLDALNF